MRTWVRRLAIVALVALVPVLGFAGSVGYRIYFHGPGALERMATSAKVTILRYGPDPLQHAALRLPGGKGPFPVVVVLHGGCWRTGFATEKSTAPLADALTARGFATLNVEYRQVGNPGGGWPGTFLDVGAAIDGLRGLARTYPLDLRRVTVAGHSAGAHLALWSAARPQLAADSEVRGRQPLAPTAVVAVDGPGALAEFIGPDVKICGEPAIVPFIGGTPRQFPRRYADASPQDHLPLGVRQALAQGAFADLMEPYIAQARQSGDPVTVYRPADGKHFDIVNPQEEQGRGTIDLIVRTAR